jgi:hypothetical protein
MLRGNFVARRSIEDTPPAAIERMRAKRPGLMRRLVKRPMVLVGPAETHVSRAHAVGIAPVNHGGGTP